MVFDDINQAGDYIRQQIEGYLMSKGINTRRNFRCLSPDHLDIHPSMSYYRAGKIVKCFGCGKSYDIIGLICIDYNLNRSEAFKKACDMFDVSCIKRKSPKPAFKYTFDYGVTNDTLDPPAYNSENQRVTERTKDYTDYIKDCKRNIDETDYLLGRGLSQDIIERFNIGYDTKKSVIVIPYNNENSFFITRSTKDKTYIKPPRLEAGPEPVFNREALYNKDKRPVFVTEGIIDALSIIEVGGEAIALNGTGYNNLLEQHKKKPIETLLLLSMDNDEAGKRAAEQLKRVLNPQNIPFLEANFLGHYKDPNEYLMTDMQGFIKAVIDTLKVAQGQLLINKKQTQERVERLSKLCEHMRELMTSAKRDEELGLHESMESHYLKMEAYRTMEKIYKSECLKLPRDIAPPRIDTKVNTKIGGNVMEDLINFVVCRGCHDDYHKEATRDGYCLTCYEERKFEDEDFDE